MTRPPWRSSTVITFLLRERPRGRTIQSANSNETDNKARFSISDPTRCPPRGFTTPSIQLQLLLPHDIVILFLFPALSNLICCTFYLHRASPAFSLPETVRPSPVHTDPFPLIMARAVKLRKNSTIIPCVWKSCPHLLSFTPRSRDPLRTLLTADTSRNELDPRSDDNSDAK